MFYNKFVSIDIGSEKIKIIEVLKSGRTVKVLKAVTVNTPVNSLSDGMIINMITMKEKIADTLRENNIKTKGIVFSSSSSTIISRVISIPIGNSKDMEGAVRYQLEQYLPINFDDFIIKFRFLDQVQDEQGEKARIRAVVYPKDMANGYIDLCKGLKLNPIALDVHSNSICKLISNGKKINDIEYGFENNIAAIDIGYASINFSVVKSRNVEFTRIINSGGSYIDMDIMQQLTIEGKVAETKKIEELDLTKVSFNDEENSMINKIGKMVVDEWISEIYKLLEYYKNTHKGEAVKEIYIYGGSSRIKGLESYMTSGLNVPVKQIESLENLVFTDKNVENKQDYFNAAGAAIRL